MKVHSTGSSPSPATRRSPGGPESKGRRGGRSGSSTGRPAVGSTSTAQGIAALGADFLEVTGDEQDRRLRSNRELKALFYTHACEGAYGAPEYGGNPDGAGWAAIEFPGDSQPRGYTDEEVRGRD